MKQCIEIKGSQMEPDFLASVRSIRKPRIIIHVNLCHMSDKETTTVLISSYKCGKIGH